MVKRKYLILAWIIFVPLKTVAISAWQPHKGEYKFLSSTLIADKTSRNVIKDRVKQYKLLEDQISNLLNIVIQLEDESTFATRHPGIVRKLEQLTLRLSDYPTTINKYKYKQVLETIERMKSKEAHAASLIKENINELKEVLCLLHADQMTQIINSSIEYGATDDSSIGVETQYTYNQFTNSKYTSTRYKSQTKAFDVFYKYKLFQNEHFVFSIQPQLSMVNDLSNQYQKFADIFIATGAVANKGEYEAFTETYVNFGRGISRCNHKRLYFNVGLTEGVKLPFGISITNHTRYSFSNNLLYERVIYEQFSVAKEIISGNILPVDLTLQYGYFWQRNLRYKSLKMSGSVISLWLEI